MSVIRYSIFFNCVSNKYELKKSRVICLKLFYTIRLIKRQSKYIHLAHFKQQDNPSCLQEKKSSKRVKHFAISLPHLPFSFTALQLTARLPKQHPRVQSVSKYHGIFLVIPAELPVLPPDAPLLGVLEPPLPLLLEPAEDAAPLQTPPGSLPSLAQTPALRRHHSNLAFLRLKLLSPVILCLKHGGKHKEEPKK